MAEGNDIPQGHSGRAASARLVVAITGASAGVGRATARAFAAQGASVGLIARNREALEAARGEVERAGGRALVCVADVADADQVAAAARSIEQALGPIDVWVNNAMATVVSPVALLEPGEVRRVTEVSYLGAVHGTLEALKRMRARNHGVIVQVGSALAYRAIPLQAAYCGAKFALRGFTDGLRSELMHEGSAVHVTMVQLPALDTPQFDWCRTRMSRAPRPVPPVFAPEVAARAIVWASRRRRREVVVGWPALRAIWANKFVPGLADRFLAAQGYEGQMGPEPVAADRPDNLFAPVPGDAGAHGRFGALSRPYSIHAWLDRHRASAALVLLGALGAAAGLGWARRRGAQR